MIRKLRQTQIHRCLINFCRIGFETDHPIGFFQSENFGNSQNLEARAGEMGVDQRGVDERTRISNENRKNGEVVDVNIRRVRNVSMALDLSIRASTAFSTKSMEM